MRKSSTHRNENTKHQAPNTKKAPNLKLQFDGISAAFGIWSLEFFWSLVFGIWCFIRGSWRRKFVTTLYGSSDPTRDSSGPAARAGYPRLPTRLERAAPIRRAAPARPCALLLGGRRGRTGRRGAHDPVRHPGPEDRVVQAGARIGSGGTRPPLVRPQGHTAHNSTHPQPLPGGERAAVSTARCPLPGGEQAFVRAGSVPLLGGVRGGSVSPIPQLFGEWDSFHSHWSANRNRRRLRTDQAGRC